MKIALFSDIHSNLPALEGFFRSVTLQTPDVMYCLGDLVGYATWPNEVIDTLRQKNIPVIAGNYDVGIGMKSDDCGCAYKTTEEKQMGAISIAYTNDSIQESQRKYLRSLPAHLRVDFDYNREKISLLLVHGSPRKVNEYLFEDREEKSLLRILEDAEASILCFGHTHKPFYRILPSQKNEPSYRHAINIGSVGKPKDHDPRGGYVILTIDERSNAAIKESIRIEFIRFDYDIEKAALSIESSPLPDKYADMLRKGY